MVLLGLLVRHFGRLHDSNVRCGKVMKGLGDFGGGVLWLDALSGKL